MSTKGGFHNKEICSGKLLTSINFAHHWQTKIKKSLFTPIDTLNFRRKVKCFFFCFHNNTGAVGVNNSEMKNNLN